MPYSQWKKRVLDNPLPVMVHLWSETMVPARSKALAPIVAEVALEFSGRIDAVRASTYHAVYHQWRFCAIRCQGWSAHVPRALESVPIVLQCTLAYDTDPHALDIETRCIPAVAFFKVRPGHVVSSCQLDSE